MKYVVNNAYSYLCGGKCNPFRNFTAEEIISATDNFRKGEIPMEFTSLYHSCFENRSVLVEMVIEKDDHRDQRSDLIRGLAIALQVSHQSNTLKLLGICLEFVIPAIVYEKLKLLIRKGKYKEGETLF